MAKPKLTLKKIKTELEKLTTLDEKRQRLEKILKDIKAPKLKAGVQKLLDEVLKHLEHEKKFDKKELEQKLTGGLPSAKEIEAAEFGAATRAGPIKYVPRPETSALEREVKGAPLPLKFTMPGEIKYEPRRLDYAAFRESIEQMRHYLKEHAKLANVFTPTGWTGLGIESRRAIEAKIGEMIGTDDPDRIMKYVNPVFGIGRPEEKYKAKR